MSWLSIFAFFGGIIAIAALFGLNPKGGRPVAGTSLMGVGRVVLAIAIVVIVVMAWRARG